MNIDNKEQSLLYLIAPTEVESLLVDWLIESEFVRGFSSIPMSGHGGDNVAMSIAEQVEGRRWQVLYIVRLSQADLDMLIQALQKEMAHIGIEYWVAPITDHGKIL